MSSRDRMLRVVRQWWGVGLSTIVVVATLWLALTGQLTLYIHPRYVVFTVAMAVVALALTVLALRSQPRDEPEVPRRGAGRALGALGAVTAVALAGAMLVLPPTTLSAQTLDQRDLNGAAATGQTVEQAESAGGGASLSFTVRDWASLLLQTSDTAFYADKPADVVGFVAADPDDPENVFYVSRFVVTCCAVDAQPVGVPVYLPDWQSQFAVDEWVRVAGDFERHDGAQAIVLEPAEIESVPQPDEPYLF